MLLSPAGLIVSYRALQSCWMVLFTLALSQSKQSLWLVGIDGKQPG